MKEISDKIIKNKIKFNNDCSEEYIDLVNKLL